MTEYDADLLQAEKAIERALIAAIREREELHDKQVLLEADMALAQRRVESLVEAHDRLRSISGRDNGLPPIEQPASPWPGSTVEAVKLILREEAGRSFSVNELLSEFGERGWLDPELKAPGPTIYQAARRAAERGDGVHYANKRFSASASESTEVPMSSVIPWAVRTQDSSQGSLAG